MNAKKISVMHGAFSLLKLLATIGIISILVRLLLPSLSRFIITVLPLLGIICTSTFAQGTVLFKNADLIDPLSGASYDALVYTADGVPAGPNFSAGLYLVNGASESLIFVSPLRSRNPGQINPFEVQVPGVLPGQSATFRVKVFETSAGSYENAIQAGQCAGVFPTISGGYNITMNLGEIGAPPHIPTPQLNGLLPLTLACIPEPSTLATFAFGSILLLLCSGVRP